MTPEQFWDGDCELVIAYRKASKIKMDLQNQQAWLNGLYIYQALIDVAPAMRAMGAKKPLKYPKEPFNFNLSEIRKKEAEEKNYNKAKAYMEAFMAQTNKKFQK